jgi:hypothetical protein
MPKHAIPEHAGRFTVSKHWHGHYLVMNDKTGKNQVNIAIEGREAALELCRRLNEGDHQGVITVPGLKGH